MGLNRLTPRIGRCCVWSVLLAHAALTFARSHEPSASRLIRPAFSARRTAVSVTPSSRLLVMRIHTQARESSFK